MIGMSKEERKVLKDFFSSLAALTEAEATERLHGPRFGRADATRSAEAQFQKSLAVAAETFSK